MDRIDSTPQARRQRRRSAFTFLEILTVFVIFGIVTAMAVPKMRGYREQAQLRSAKQHIAAYLTSARAAAIRRGRSSTFTVTANNQLSVAVDSSGVQVPLARAFSIKDVYLVNMPGGAMTVTFDRRGYAASSKIVIANDRGRDSVCVTKLGNILVDNCTP